MRYAIISDIHSNLEALKTVLLEIEKEQVDKIFCLGDIVGYGPYPNECIELVKKNCEIILAGNHDYACIDRDELMYFNRFAKEAIEWTLSVLTKENIKFISELPFQSVRNNFCMVHSNPYRPESWEYILDLDEAIFNFSKFNEQICFIGHSHRPIVFLESDEQKYSTLEDSKVFINSNFRYIINVGSVGQPRDNNPAAAFSLFDTSEQSSELIRVGYDVEKTCTKMKKLGLPQFLADRLLTGK